MGLLYNDSGVVGNSVYISGSFWFVNPIGGSGADLLLVFNDTVTTLSVFTIYQSRSGAGNAINFICQNDNLAIRSEVLFSVQAYSLLATSKWTHVIFAIDTSTAGPLGVPPSPQKICKVVINGLYQPGPSGPMFQTDPLAGTPLGYAMNFSACKIGIPTTPEAGLNSTPIPMYQTQIYPGQFIDPTISNNFTKFITVNSGGVATPAPLSLARNAFGVPAIEMKGDAAHFKNNTGSCGPFTEVGVSHNYSNTPSYGP